jgi:hypothetical protein
VPHRPYHARRALLPRFDRSLATLALVAVLAACAGTATPGIALALDDPAPSAIRGETVQVGVDLTRLGGADAAVVLSVAGLPAHVTATFAPASLTGSVTESVLTLTVGAAASEGTVDLTVAGVAGALTDAVDLTLAIGSLTVHGRVQQTLRRPVVGATVVIQGSSVATDATGAFTIGGLSVPYDVVVGSSLGSGTVHRFEGLTSPTPMLRPTLDANRAPTLGFGTSVDGAFDGGALGADEVVVVCVEGLDEVVSGCDTLGVGAAAYSIGAGWFDAAVVPVRVHALRFVVDGTGVPTAYLGYASSALDLTDGVAAVADLDFDPVGADALTGTTDHPAALPDTDLVVLARFGPHLSMPIVEVADPADAFALLVPVLPGLSYDVLFVGSGAGDTVLSWKHDVGLEAGALRVVPTAQPVAPAEGASAVDGTTPFGSTAVGGARTYVWIAVGAPGVVIALTTTQTTVTIPDPTIGGYPFPAGAAYTWRVLGHGDADADAAAAGGYADYFTLLVALLTGGGPGVDGDRTFALTGDARGLTFAP